MKWGYAHTYGPFEMWEALGFQQTAKRMESEGTIQGYTVRVDPLAIGLTDTVIVQVTLESHTDETLYEFGRALEEIPEVLEAYLISGDYDYYIRIAVRDTRDYERLLRERLYRIPGIRHSKSSFVLRTLKESLLPLSTAPVASSTRQVKKPARVPPVPTPALRPRAKATTGRRR